MNIRDSPESNSIRVAVRLEEDKIRYRLEGIAHPLSVYFHVMGRRYVIAMEDSSELFGAPYLVCAGITYVYALSGAAATSLIGVVETRSLANSGLPLDEYK